MKLCKGCGLEKEHHIIKTNELYFCSPACLVNFARREKHPLLKAETYDMYKSIVDEGEKPTEMQINLQKTLEEFKKVEQLFANYGGCGKADCCKVVTCVCRSFNADELLKEVLKDEKA